MHVLANYLVSTILIARALGQTPPDTQPITNDILGVSYGATNVVPGIELPLTGISRRLCSVPATF